MLDQGVRQPLVTVAWIRHGSKDALVMTKASLSSQTVRSIAFWNPSNVCRYNFTWLSATTLELHYQGTHDRQVLWQMTSPSRRTIGWPNHATILKSRLICRLPAEDDNANVGVGKDLETEPIPRIPWWLLLASERSCNGSKTSLRGMKQYKIPWMSINYSIQSSCKLLTTSLKIPRRLGGFAILSEVSLNNISKCPFGHLLESKSAPGFYYFASLKHGQLLHLCCQQVGQSAELFVFAWPTLCQCWDTPGQNLQQCLSFKECWK